MDRVIQSFIPPGLKVAVGVAVSDDGLANISLTGDVGTLSPDAVGLMMAQFAWTLRQDPSVTGIRVSIDGEPVPLPEGMSTYRIDGGAEYDPAGFRASPLLYGLRDGLLASATTGSLTAVSGPMGTDDLGLRSVGLNLDATIAAGVTDDGGSVIEAPVSSSDDGRARTVFYGQDLLTPRWDFADRMWLVDRTAGRRRGVVASATVTPAPSRCRASPASRSGRSWSRATAPAWWPSYDGPGGDSLMISRIAHSRTGRVLRASAARRISTDLDNPLPVQAIAWRTSSSIAVLNPFTKSTVPGARWRRSTARPAGSDSSVGGSPRPAACARRVARHRRAPARDHPRQPARPLVRGPTDRPARRRGQAASPTPADPQAARPTLSPPTGAGGIGPWRPRSAASSPTAGSTCCSAADASAANDPAGCCATPAPRRCRPGAGPPGRLRCPPACGLPGRPRSTPGCPARWCSATRSAGSWACVPRSVGSSPERWAPALSEHTGPVVLVPVPSRPGADRVRGHDPTGAMTARAARTLRAGGVDALALPVLRSRRGVVDQAGLGATATSRQPGRLDALSRRPAPPPRRTPSSRALRRL